ncbi:MAG: aminopeptidase P family N-terminal domain-containing protein, partial [Dehalococcoidia bacterium]
MPQAFTPDEMSRRVVKLQEEMDRAGIDCAIASSVHTSFYYSGFWFSLPFGRLGATIVPRQGEVVLIAPQMESHRARDFSWLKDIRTYSDDKSALSGTVDLLKQVISEKGLEQGKIGVEEDALPHAQWVAIREAFPRASLVDISQIMMRQRFVKSPEEIELMKQGGEVCVAAAKALEEALEEGVTEIDVAAAGATVMGEEFKRRFPDFEYTGVLSVCRSGHRSIYGHTGPTAKRIQRGEVNLFGAEPEIMGYYYTLLRERVVGPVPEAMKKPFDVRLEAAHRC